MTARFRRSIVCILIAALVISGAALLIGFSESGPVLQIRDSASGRLYGSWPLETAGDSSGEFSIEFVHSVNQSPIQEIFKAEKSSFRRSIRPLAVRFYSFGAGVKSDLEEGQTLSRDGDAMIISGFKNSFRELNYIVGTVSDHLLYVGSETVSLRDLCGRNAHITIVIK